MLDTSERLIFLTRHQLDAPYDRTLGSLYTWLGSYVHCISQSVVSSSQCETSEKKNDQRRPARLRCWNFGPFEMYYRLEALNIIF